MPGGGLYGELPPRRGGVRSFRRQLAEASPVGMGGGRLLGVESHPWLPAAQRSSSGSPPSSSSDSSSGSGRRAAASSGTTSASWSRDRSTGPASSRPPTSAT